MMKFHCKRNYAGVFGVFEAYLVDSDTGSENVSLIRLPALEALKTCSSMDVSLIGT